MKKNFFKTITSLMIVFLFGFIFTKQAFAESDSLSLDSSIIMSPMYEKISLKPGESYSGSFVITTPNTSSTNFNYRIFTQAYYRDEKDSVVFQNINDRSLISNWTTINSATTGVLTPGEGTTIYFTINVPLDAPAGGQYEAITVASSSKSDSTSEGSAVIHENIALGYTIYAEIEGNTIHDGEFLSVEVPSFLLSGDIFGTATIKNNGNVHDSAIYTLQVFPLFSNEEIYTNEEEPVSRLILPDRALAYTTYWEDTPTVGIFNVVYTVKFAGQVRQISKLVIVCPIWLLFIIIFAIMLVAFWLFTKSKSNKKSKR